MFFIDLFPTKEEIELEKVNNKCKEIFKNVSLLADEMNIDSTLSLCNLYSYLLYTGNLSVDKRFKQSIDKIVNDGAANIMLGYGCCRNICDGLLTLLRINNIENYELTTKFNPNKIISKYDPIFKNKYDPDGIKTKITRFFYSFKPYDYKSSHALNLVVEDNSYFVYDATWLLLLKIKGSRLKVINGTGYMEILFPESNFKDFLYGESSETRNYLNQLKCLCTYKFDEFKSHSESDFINFKDNSKLINSFYIDAHPNIESVCKMLKPRNNS